MTGKLLFTPGPLTTSLAVKEAMLRDFGSRDTAFIDAVRRVREMLLALVGTSQQEGFEAVLMQGSGTFGLESVLSSTVPAGGRVLIVVNGAYGERMVRMAEVHGIDASVLRYREDECPEAGPVREALAADPAITHVLMVHCETTTGILNPIEEIGAVVREAGRLFFVDAMSSLGAIPVDLDRAGVDFLVSSSNKCLEGVPGFSIVLARRSALVATEGASRTISLDLQAQWRGLEANGQFRFTPPTHAIIALATALEALEAEGGVAGRAARYSANHGRLVEGMRKLGFRTYVPPALQSCIITSFHYPDDPCFEFSAFYASLNQRGFVIYPGKVSHADCFRIGTIGQVFPDDVSRLLEGIEHTLREMGVRMVGEPLP